MFHQMIYTFLLCFLLFTLSTPQQVNDKSQTKSQLVLNQVQQEKANALMINQKLQVYQDDMNKNLRVQIQGLDNLKKQTDIKLEELKKLDEQIKAWNQFLGVINQFLKKGIQIFQEFNKKLSEIMARIVGFEETLKTVISLDTLIVCLLSFILVKILKDQFIDQGYQRIDTLQNPSPQINISTVQTINE